MKPVLVLDANQRSALAVTRSLGKRGIKVITADETHKSLSGSSRYSFCNFTYPTPKHNSDNFIESLCDAIKKYDIRVVRIKRKIWHEKG